jgi:hypothetical protein
MPYLNKRNRFIQAAKTHAESNTRTYDLTVLFNAVPA